MSATIYLHWTATPYNWVRSGLYHSIIGGDGQVHRLHSYGADLPAHTWRRNTNAVALSCACMGGRPDPWTIPPAKPQLESLCQEAAAVARSWGWSADQISIQRLMTHAEAAANRDGRVMHDNYGPVIWGGTGERWDLLQLEKGGPPTGGEQLRERVRQLLSGEAASGPAPLQFRRAGSIEARGLPLATEIDAKGSSWALATALLERYELPFQWDACKATHGGSLNKGLFHSRVAERIPLLQQVDAQHRYQRKWRAATLLAGLGVVGLDQFDECLQGHHRVHLR